METVNFSEFYGEQKVRKHSIYLKWKIFHCNFKSMYCILAE